METKECEDHNNVKNEVRSPRKKWVREKFDLEKLLREAGENIKTKQEDKPKINSLVSQTGVKRANKHIATGAVPKKKTILNVDVAKATCNLHASENLTQGNIIITPTIIISSEWSSEEIEYFEPEKVIMNQKSMPKMNQLNYRQKIANLLEEDKLALLKCKAEVMELVSEFVSMQEKRHNKILQLLLADNS